MADHQRAPGQALPPTGPPAAVEVGGGDLPELIADVLGGLAAAGGGRAAGPWMAGQRPSWGQWPGLPGSAGCRWR
jgi:hypothetical protein